MLCKFELVEQKCKGIVRNILKKMARHASCHNWCSQTNKQVIDHFLVVYSQYPCKQPLCIETFNATDSLYNNVILCMHGSSTACTMPLPPTASVMPFPLSSSAVVSVTRSCESNSISQDRYRLYNWINSCRLFITAEGAVAFLVTSGSLCKNLIQYSHQDHNSSSYCTA